MTECFMAGLHFGNVVGYLALAYKQPIQVILELIQNSIDAEARNIFLKIDHKRKIIYCADDGIGESAENLQKRFSCIGETQKVGKIGHKGIGNLAPLAIAESFRITTRFKSDSKSRFHSVNLRNSDLEDHKEGIPLQINQESKDYRPGSINKLMVDFSISTLHMTTNVKKPGLMKLGSASEIAKAIEERFAHQILGKNIRVFVESNAQRVKVNPKPFTGEAHETTISTSRGDVRFEIYSQPKPDRKPRINIVHGENEDSQSSIGIDCMLDVSPEIKSIFSSGYFQGNIYVPFCKLTPSRDEFEYDEDLGMLWDTIDEWAKKYGRPILDKIIEDKEDLMISRALLQALGLVEGYLKVNPQIAKVFNSPVSKGHANTDGDPPTNNLLSRDPLKNKGISGERNGSDARERSMMHNGVRNAGGAKRVQRKNQKGIQAEYRIPRLDEPRDWRSKREGAVIVFNAAHPDWNKLVSMKDDMLAKYCAQLILKEFCLVEHDSKEFETIFDSMFIPGWISTIKKK